MDSSSRIDIIHHMCRVRVRVRLVLIIMRYSVVLISLLLSALPPSLCQPPRSNYTSVCSQPYKCGEHPELYYPFWGRGDNVRPAFCGGGDQFKLTCEEMDQPSYGGNGASTYYTSFIEMGSQKFEVSDIDPTAYTMKMVPMGEGPDVVCSPDFNFSLSPVFRYDQIVHNITVILISDCPRGVSPSGDGKNFTCHDGVAVLYYYDEGGKEEVLKQHPELDGCGRIMEMPAEAVDVARHGGDAVDALQGALGEGFNVRYSVSEECMRCAGSKEAWCGSNDESEFTCYCPHNRFSARNCFGHAPPPATAPPPAHAPAAAPPPAHAPAAAHKSRGINWQVKLGIGVGAAVFGVLAASLAFVYCQRQKKASDGISYVQPRSMSSDPSSLKDTEAGSINYGVHLFTYNELEEATNFFDPSRELGEGGFGTVYYGKLRDGRCVAVKRLYENNYKRVEQFKNEIEILTGLHHKNLVSLYGCTSRHSRELLLVYEYIPNGTVADHLHGERAKAGKLPWHIRMNIAVETASALAYLHASEVIHRDVKTNNILLDSHFVVKVADFGLSRLFPTHVTHVSTAPQGTPGYVDPEYHECYQLTVKSDVYSFGVVLVELISSLPAVDITRHRHEINLSNMAINKIHNQALHELVDPNLGFDSDYKVRKMINAVAELAFQCLQSSKDMRPSMEEVLDTLRDIQSDGKYKSQPEVMDISTADDVVLLKDDPPPPSPDSNVVSKSTTPNASG